MHGIAGILFLCIAVLAALGVPLARKFLRGLTRGTHVYVVFEVDGRMLCFKNPDRPFEPVDKPLESVPVEIFNPDQYETYYNICWFDDLGTLKRCGHWYHRTAENAALLQIEQPATLVHRKNSGRAVGFRRPNACYLPANSGTNDISSTAINSTLIVLRESNRH